MPLDAMQSSKTEEQVFESVAGLFSVLSTPIRPKINCALCNGEKNVSELLAEIETTQPSMSQHLAMLCRRGVPANRREGTQVHGRLQSERVAKLCRAVFTQVAIELDSATPHDPADRRVPALRR